MIHSLLIDVLVLKALKAHIKAFILLIKVLILQDFLDKAWLKVLYAFIQVINSLIIDINVKVISEHLHIFNITIHLL